MARRRETDRDAVADWLLERKPRRRSQDTGKPRGAISRATAQWLKFPAPAKRRAEADQREKGVEKRASGRRRRSDATSSSPRLLRLPASLGGRGLPQKLREAQQRVAAQEREIAQLRDRVKTLEGRLRKKRARTGSKRGQRQPQSRARTGSRGKAGADDGPASATAARAKRTQSSGKGRGSTRPGRSK